MRGKKLATLKILLASLFVMSMVFVMNTVTAEAATPAKVTGVKQIGGDEDSVKVTWNTVVGSDINYIVEYSQDKKTWGEERSYSSNEETIYNLTGGSTYFVRVKAISGYYSSSSRQDGAYSDVIEVVTAPNVTTEAIAQFDATSSSVSVCWNAVPGATSYDVYVYNHNMSSENIFVGTTSATSTSISGLLPDESYGVHVYPKRTAVSAPNYTATDSSEYMYSAGILTTPGVINLKVTDRDPRKKVSGKKNADYNTLEVDYDYCTNISGYEVYLYSSNGKLKKTIDNQDRFKTYSRFKGVKTTDTVLVQVRPYIILNGAKKYGDASAKVLSVGAPTAKVSKNGSGIKISWTKVQGAKKYEVYMSTTSNKGYKKIGTVSSKKTSLVVNKFKGKNFQKYKNYYYYVKAVGNYGGKKNAKSDTFYTNYFWFSSRGIY